MFRLKGNSKNEEMLNFGGRVYNMNGGYGRVLKPKFLNETQIILKEEKAFVLGKDAFSSPLELRKTILHELYRLNTSNLKGQNVTQGAVSGEIKSAFDFAEKNVQKLK